MGIGFRELLIILVIALLIFGAKRLRTIGTDLGAAVRGFKKSMGEGEEDSRDFTVTPRETPPQQLASNPAAAADPAQNDAQKTDQKTKTRSDVG